MIKRHKELIVIIPLVALSAIVIGNFLLGNISSIQKPELVSGVMVEYNGEWIGGNIINDGKIIVLQNGTEMNYLKFKQITGMKDDKNN